MMCEYMELRTPIIVSSSVEIDHNLAAQEKVISLCHALNADVYVNPIGGIDLYDRSEFRDHGIDLQFIKPTPLVYEQFGGPFIPNLSIIDVLMFNPLSDVQTVISSHFGLC